MCSSLPARLMEEFQARGTYNMQADLLGSFPVDVSPGTSGRFGWGHRTKFRPSVGGRGGHRNMGVTIGRIYPFRGLRSFWQKNSCQIFYTSNSNRHPPLYFSKQHFPSLDILLLPKSHPAKIGLKNIYFFRNRSIGCPWCMLWMEKILEHVLVFLFIHILKTAYLQQLFSLFSVTFVLFEEIICYIIPDSNIHCLKRWWRLWL